MSSMNTKTISLPSIFPVACHTNNVGPGTIFVAIKGTHTDGALFIPQALEQGAGTIVVAHDARLSPQTKQIIKNYDAKLTYVPNTRQALAQLSAQHSGCPAKKLKIIATTGTKGKTTTCFLLEHILRTAGHKTALLSSVKNTILTTEFNTTLTTAQPDYLHVFFAQCVKSSVEFVVMETAAQAFSLYRTWGIEFDAGIFTNFDLEHSEFYPTIEDYFQAKCTLFQQLKSKAFLYLNADDTRCATLTSDRTKLFGIQSADVDFKGLVKSYAVDGLIMEVVTTKENDIVSYSIPVLMGKFNAYNVLAAISACHDLGIQSSVMTKALLSFTPIAGRLNKYHLANGAYCFIDNAHNPSSYKAVLSTLRELTNHLIVVFGAGGNRDRTKRPLMGAIAAHYADQIVLTSDNPRFEKAETIVEEIKHGIPPTKKTLVIEELDREKALRKAYSLSRKNSIIVVLGKGHDEYQQVGTVKNYFSEKTIVQTFQSTPGEV